MKLKFRLSVIAIALVVAFSPLSAAQKSITLKIFPESYALSIDGAQVNPQKVTQYLKRFRRVSASSFSNQRDTLIRKLRLI